MVASASLFPLVAQRYQRSCSCVADPSLSDSSANSRRLPTAFGHSTLRLKVFGAFTVAPRWQLRCLTGIGIGENMKPSTTDRIKGKMHEVKGAVREKAGRLTNNPNLKSEGQAEKLAGKVQKKIGQVEKIFEK